MRVYVTCVKKVLDFVIALIGLCLLCPFLSFVALLLFIVHRSFKGIFFVQSRVGYKGRIFKILKFKTMSDRRDEDGVLLPDAERLTPMGKIVRALSIDELPQLINVLKGDMALIGPRPLLPKYLPLYSDEQLKTS